MTRSARLSSEPGVVFVSVLTTGPDPQKDAIVDVGAVKIVAGTAGGRFAAVVQSAVRVPLAVRRLTGLDEQTVQREGIPAEAVVAGFRAFAGRAAVWGWDVPSVEPFLTRSGFLSDETAVPDLCELSCMLLPVLGDYSLHGLAAHFGIPVEDRRRAVSRAAVMGMIWKALLDGLDGRHARLITDVDRIMRGTPWALSSLFERLARELGHLPDPAGDRRRKSCITSRCRESGTQALSPPEVASVFDPGGPLDAFLPGYERRPEQREMAVLVAEALEKGRHLFVEAGTGIGKSLAYLVPAIVRARGQGSPVLISTHTRNLQDQLWTKEIPFLAEHLRVPFTAALIKGRENYVCLRRWQEMVTPAGSLFEERIGAAYLTAWRQSTPDGFLETVSGRYPSVRETVELVRSSAAMCLEGSCPFRGQCFYQHARRLSLSADILISNHALTLSAPPWLPPVEQVIFDEAQHIEPVVAELFSRQVSSGDVVSLAGDLSGRSDRRGILAPLWRAARSGPTPDALGDAEKFRHQLTEASAALRTQAEAVTRAVEVFCVDATGEHRRRRMSLARMKKDAGWEAVAGAVQALETEIGRIADNVVVFRAHVDERWPAGDRKEEAAAILGWLSRCLKDLVESIRFIFSETDRSFVSWCECSLDDGTCEWRFCATPLDPGVFLADFYREKHCVVHTSATLTVGGSFDFIVHRTGARAAADRISTARFDSPFDYQGRVVLVVPGDVPPYEYRNPEPFIAALVEGITAVTNSSGGKFLALFSSVARMREVADRVRSELESRGVVLLCQGVDGTRNALAGRMRILPGDAVLFGTRSFKEGVDIPGLRGVLIDKIPFVPPDDPVAEARRRLAGEQGRDYWHEYALPVAAMDLRQSFGRLMRRTTDSGIIVIFDIRLLGRFRELLRSFPPCPIRTPPLHRLREEITVPDSSSVRPPEREKQNQEHRTVLRCKERCD